MRSRVKSSSGEVEMRLPKLRAGIPVAAVLLSAGLLGSPAEAALVTLCGPTICYEYDNNPGVNAGITQFGAPTLLGGSDTLKFTPTNFNADSDPGTLTIPGPTVSAVFQFTRVYTTNGGEIATISVTESGDYQIIDGGASTGFVNVNMRLQSVDNVNNGPTTGFPEVTNPLYNWNTTTPTGLGLANWSLTGTVTPAALFADLASDVDLQIQNTLQACSSMTPSQCAAGTGTDYAFIAKKLTLTATSTVVPVPAAAWLFGSGLGLLGWMRRNRSSI
jgi:hypothetical protein